MNEITITSGFNRIDDPHPESRAFTNIKFYNHLIQHMETKRHKFCSIDCMTREFEPRNIESNRRVMRRRLPTFGRWCREEQGKFVVVPKGNSHGEALAAKLFDPLIADDRDRELVAADLNRALHRKEITNETYHRIFELVYPMLNENKNEKENTTEEPPHAD